MFKRNGTMQVKPRTDMKGHPVTKTPPSSRGRNLKTAGCKGNVETWEVFDANFSGSERTAEDWAGPGVFKPAVILRKGKAA